MSKASHAGIRAAEEIRHLGYDGSLRFLSEEAELPYERPPLSTEFLLGQIDSAALSMPQSDIAELMLDIGAIELDTRNHLLTLSDGSSLTFDGLVIATGARPRTMPDEERAHDAFTLYTLGEAQALRLELQREPRVVIIGAGLTGLEVASSCRTIGLGTTPVELLSTPLGRVLDEELGQRVAGLARAHGVNLITGRTAVRSCAPGPFERRTVPAR
ncbi:FAD-dependent oxidoreductase [Rhodococcus koreensis]|uniref:FAD-dependent oxidoreductase n=1 Tax=Rhodococcus koreensis TaxID=99653 RepID=UPI0019811616|nr:FAD/NAD(P)-binding oxidoreductase [Rhodococcus koreensis]QSE86657.1 NAD(P)/FAD-dependent oxidoreductase [Rhodococcus koreensis]